MNKAQFKITKFFLDGFKIPADKLAKAWGVDKMLMRRAAASANWEHFNEMPEEDVMTLFNSIFGGKK